MNRRSSLFVFAFIALLSPATWAQVPDKQKVVAGADRAFEKFTKVYVAPAPGCAAAVSLNGDVVFEKAFGLADLEHNVPNTPQTIFESGSVAKQFTAAALVLLQQDGKLSIDDRVRKYIPELPDYGAPLTIRHLLNHTSGLRDWGSVMGPDRRGSWRPRHHSGSRVRRYYSSTRTRLHTRFGIFVFEQRLQSRGHNRRARFKTEVPRLRRGTAIQTTRHEEQFVARRLPANRSWSRASIRAFKQWTMAAQHALHERLWKRRHAHHRRRLDDLERDA